MVNFNKLIIGVIASLIIGILIGMGVKGDSKAKNQKINQELQSTVQELENLKGENKELKAVIARSEKNIEADKKRSEELVSLKAQLNKAQLDKSDLQGIISQLQSQKPKDESDITALKAMNKKLENTLSSLEKEKQDLIAKLKSTQDEIMKSANVITKLQSDVATFRDQLMKKKESLNVSEEVTQRITDLENENQKLKSIVDNINTMLQGR